MRETANPLPAPIESKESPKAKGAAFGRKITFKDWMVNESKGKTTTQPKNAGSLVQASTDSLGKQGTFGR